MRATLSAVLTWKSVMWISRNGACIGVIDALSVPFSLVVSESESLPPIAGTASVASTVAQESLSTIVNSSWPEGGSLVR